MGQKPSSVLREHTMKEELERYSQQQNSRDNLLRCHLTGQPTNNHILLTDAMERVIKCQLDRPFESDEEPEAMQGSTRAISCSKPKAPPSSVETAALNTASPAVANEPVPNKYKGPKKRFLQQYANEAEQEEVPQSNSTTTAIGEDKSYKSGASTTLPSQKAGEETAREQMAEIAAISRHSLSAMEVMLKHQLMDGQEIPGNSQDDFLQESIRQVLKQSGKEDLDIVRRYTESKPGADSASHKRSTTLATMLTRPKDISMHINNTIRNEVYSAATSDHAVSEAQSSVSQTQLNSNTAGKPKPLTVKEHIQEAIKAQLGLSNLPDHSQRIHEAYSQSLQSTHNINRDRNR